MMLGDDYRYYCRGVWDKVVAAASGEGTQRGGGIISCMKTYGVVISEENGWLVALEPQSGVASQGKTLDEAMSNIREALELYLEELGEVDNNKDNSSSRTFLTTVTV